MNQRSRPWSALAAIVAVTAMVAAGCGSSATDDAGSSSSTDSGSAADAGSTAGSDSSSDSSATGTISLWHYFTDREAEVVQSVVDDFEDANPGITVDVHEGQDDAKMTKVIASGGDIDVAISDGTDNLGAFCSSGAFIDLAPYMEESGVEESEFLDVPIDYTKFDGTQCSLPMMSDVYGLYYNTDLLEAAGFSDPPKTLSELEDMAMELTTYNDDGSIKTLGFNPLVGFYENQSAQLMFPTGATWMNDGKSAVAESPGWAEFLNWQKNFVDELGYDKLTTFTAGLGDEWSGDQAFQTGQVAMMMDGEWRVAFIADQKPDMNYATAPFPTGDDHTDLYGGGYSSGTVVGLAKTSQNKDLAWKLVQYLTTNTDALVTLGNELNNVPTTKDSLHSADLDLPEQFQTFLDVAESGHVVSMPNTVIGDANQTTMNKFMEDWQAGSVSDLDSGLEGVDTDIDNQLSLSTGP